MKTNAFHEETYRNHTIRLEPDDFLPESPRDWSNLGKMVCWHRRYDLGDEQPTASPEEYLLGLCQEIHPNFPDEQYEKHGAAILAKHYLILPLYLYDHSGITMSTGRFSCPWDSGQVGFIYVRRDAAQKEYPGFENWEERAFALLESEVQAYDDFLTGDVAAYVVEDRAGDVVDSCCGFYPDHVGKWGDRWEYALSQARAAVDDNCERLGREEAEALYWAERDCMTVR